MKSVYTELVITKTECLLYDPEKCWKPCISAGARKLFDCMVNAVTTSRHSSDHTDLDRKRVVSLVYDMCYCQSQVCNPLRLLWSLSCQMNQEGVEPDPGIMPSNHNISLSYASGHVRLAYRDFLLTLSCNESAWMYTSTGKTTMVKI